MKIKKFVSLKDETIITEENVQILGERIAVYAVQSAKQFAYGSLNRLYKGLIRDINYDLTLTQHFTDGYDIAQEAICYLCNFLGHKLGEVCVPNIHNGIDSIKLGCYKHLYNYLRKQKKHIQTEENIERYIYKDLSEYERNYKNGNWNYVLVYKLDRFSRNKYESVVHKKTLRDNGIRLLSAMENIPDTPEGIILESVMEGFAEYYSANLSQNVKRGFLRNEGYTQSVGSSVFT